MQTPSRISARLMALAGIAACAASIAPAACQRASASSSRSRGARKTQIAPVKLGDVVISGFQSISGAVGKNAVIEGPNSTVDVVNPDEPRSKTKVQATNMTVLFDEKTNKSTKMELEGNVRVSGTRPMKEQKGVETFYVSGTKSIYYKSEGRLIMEGPVNFRGEQPAADGKSKKVVTGTGSFATYNENTEVVTLEGGFRALYSNPTMLKEPGADIAGNKLMLDLSKNPIEYKITSDKGHEHISFEPIEKPKKKEQK
jgi:hypothetical protein